jgi:hypothetical protein
MKKMFFASSLVLLATLVTLGAQPTPGKEELKLKLPADVHWHLTNLKSPNQSHHRKPRGPLRRRAPCCCCR